MAPVPCRRAGSPAARSCQLNPLIIAITSSPTDERADVTECITVGWHSDRLHSQCNRLARRQRTDARAGSTISGISVARRFCFGPRSRAGQVLEDHQVSTGRHSADLLPPMCKLSITGRLVHLSASLSRDWLEPESGLLAGHPRLHATQQTMSGLLQPKRRSQVCCNTKRRTVTERPGIGQCYVASATNG
jgi:hypothetical protein